MNISSSGESPYVVAAHTCETSATYILLVVAHRARFAFPRARCPVACKRKNFNERINYG